jgi:AAA family ATP:ADP antiporter
MLTSAQAVVHLPALPSPTCCGVCRPRRKLLSLLLQVMGYGICHKLFGFVWKGQMRLLYPSTAAYATVMADVASFTGACTIALMLVSKFIFQVCAWACSV